MAPAPGVLLQRIVPPCSSTIWREIASPRPVPCGLVVKNCSKRRRPTSAEIPGPLFSLLDLPALVAASCGIADPPWEPLAARHTAVAQFAAPGGPHDPRVATVAAALGLDESGRQRLTEPITCATDGRLKLVRRGGREELYDLRTDPLELSPATPGAADQASLTGLREVMDHACAHASPRPARGGSPDLTPEARASLESQLKLLGYL